MSLVSDKHGSFQYLIEDLKLFYDLYRPEELGIIILGDAGLNFYLNKTDEKKKAMLNNRGYKFYLVRGNHEARPEDLSNIKMIWDEEIRGNIFIEEEYPNIRYLIDGETYYFGDYKALAVGGSYSVDKWYRLEKAALGYYSGWFKNEQLSKKEMKNILANNKGKAFDLILAHTCPVSYQPVDLFLPFIDQSKVDNSMEIWFEELIQQVEYKKFLFGHYHQDRIINEKARMFYKDIVSLDQIFHYGANSVDKKL